MKTAKELLEEIKKICGEFSFVKDLDITIEDRIILKGKVLLENEFFVEIYFNEINQKTSFALIKDGKRVFGADNLGGWHSHPFKNPDFHELSEEYDFERFIGEVKRFLG